VTIKEYYIRAIHVLRRAGSALGLAFCDLIPRLKSGIIPVNRTLPEDEASGWKAYPVFKGSTNRIYELSCHVSVLSQGRCPHSPHAHEEEEVLLLLSGEIDLIFPVHDGSQETRAIRLRPGECAYYPAGHAHSLRTASEQPAQYLMLKWTTNAPSNHSALDFGCYQLFDPEQGNQSGFCPRVLFEGPTDYLKKIQCHLSTLSPGAGYEPHADPYDVVIVVLEGEVETLGKIIGPYGVIFYRSGQPHGMRNTGTETARYVVFELHARPRIVNILLKLFKERASGRPGNEGGEACTAIN